MFKAIFLALSVVAVTIPPCYAQAWLDSAGAGDTTGNESNKTGSQAAFAEGRGYGLKSPGDQSTSSGGGGGGGWTDRGYASQTKTQGFNGGVAGLVNRVTGGSGAANGGPIILKGFNTNLAPANMALRTQGGGLSLPKTNLDSFVHKAKQSGMAELIYGDEGKNGPPPYSFFMPINTGISSGGLTTGHPSDAPSAWGTPLKYNSAGGVIKGL